MFLKFRSIFQLWYTCWGVLMLTIGYIFKGAKLFEKKIREKPECLEGWDSRYIKLKNVRLHYVQTGDDSSPLMLFVHGFPEFWYSWRFQLKEFGKDYRCVAIDQRGYNLSDKPNGVEFYGIGELVGDLKDVMETLGYQKCILVAHDWGGIVGWQFANNFPEMVEKLVVMNIPRPEVVLRTIDENWTQFRKSWYILFFQSARFPEMMSAAGDLQFLEKCFRSKEAGLRNSENFTDEDLEAWKYAFSTSFKFPINYYRNIFNNEFLRSNTLEMPVQIIWGTNDVALETVMAAESLKKVLKGRLEYIQGASHWVQQDEPEKVNKLMRTFLYE